MIKFRPLLYVIFFAGIHACSSPSANPSKTTAVKTDTLAVFKWNTELCEKSGQYDPRKYTAEQLQNTYHLWFGLSGLQMESDQTVYKPADIEKLDLQKVISEYVTKRDRYKVMRIVDLPYWTDLKQQRIRELDGQYELTKLSIEAFSDPAVLANNRFAEHCQQYVKALTTSDTATLFAAWKALAEELSAKNGSPGKYLEQFHEKYNSPDKLSYAMVDLITFGWSNCANSTLHHVNRDDAMEAEFEKLFTNIKEVCDEP